MPQSAAGAVLLEVNALRQSPHRAALVQIVRRMARTSEWEGQLQLDLERDVARVALFGQVSGQLPSAELTELLSQGTLTHGGLVFERIPDEQTGQAESCHQNDLAQAEVQTLAGPNETCSVIRCGPFVQVRCRADGASSAAPEPGPDPLARDVLRNAAGQGASRQRIATLVVGPQLARQARCGQRPVGLAGWQQAVVTLDGGLGLEAELRAVSPAEAEPLRACLTESARALGAFPLLRSLGLGDLFSQVQVSQDAADPTKVRVALAISPRQMELVLTILGGEIGEAAP